MPMFGNVIREISKGKCELLQGTFVSFQHQAGDKNDSERREKLHLRGKSKCCETETKKGAVELGHATER